MTVSTVLLAALYRKVEEIGLSRIANEELSKVREIVGRLERKVVCESRRCN